MATVVINGIDLICDPDELNFGGKRRGSIQRCIDGSTIIQDRGFNAGDQTIQIKGKTPYTSVIQALYSLYRVTGATYNYSDFKGNSATVAFTPGIESLRVRPIRGSVGYEYDIFLTVVSGSVS
jgi:hypothetical protein